MFDALVARSHSLIATPELSVPLSEQAFARAALARLNTSGRKSRAAGQLTFLSGSEGIGKSFLARNAVRDARHRQPKLRFLIATALELAEFLAEANHQQNLADVLELFESLDVLVCDDLQTLEGKDDFQDLLLEAVEVVLRNPGNVLLTCRKSAGELRNFSSRWISRCHGGLCATFGGLGRKSRIEFIARLVQFHHLPFMAPVEASIEWLADRWAISPREIVTLIDRLVQHQQRQPAVIDLTFLERWLKEETPAETVSFDAITSAVANEFGIVPEELRSRSRQTGLIVARQCAMFLARELTGKPLEFIGHYFGDRTHTTVSHSLSRLKELLPHAPTLRQQVQRLRKRLSELQREDCA